MLKNKKHTRLLTLAAAIAMIVTTALAIPTSAHQHEDDEAYFIYTVNGERVTSLHSINETCGCNNPHIKNYTVNGPHNSTTKDHITPLVQVCLNCKWHIQFDAICVGGCGTFCSYPKAPSWALT